MAVKKNGASLLLKEEHGLHGCSFPFSTGPIPNPHPWFLSPLPVTHSREGPRCPPRSSLAFPCSEASWEVMQKDVDWASPVWGLSDPPLPTDPDSFSRGDCSQQFKILWASWAETKGGARAPCCPTWTLCPHLSLGNLSDPIWCGLTTPTVHGHPRSTGRTEVLQATPKPPALQCLCDHP